MKSTALKGACRIIALPAHKDRAENTDLIYLSHEVLKTHPRNLRRYYPEKDVQEMAASIKHKKGVHQALLIVPSEEKGFFYVVDGNVRLAGARYLGKEAPKLKCEVITAGKAEQLIIMAVTAKVRYDPDPVSQGLNFEMLMKEEGYSIQRITEESGIHRVTVENRLLLLKLDPEIQDLVAARALPCSKDAVEAFLSIPNKEARIKLALRLGANGASVKTIIAACARMSEALRRIAGPGGNGVTASVPSIVLGQKRASVKPVPAAKTVKWSKVRDSVKAVCEKCDIRLSILSTLSEPAWALISHAAEGTCGNCEIKEVRQACEQCPAVDIIRRLILSVSESHK